MEGRGTSRWRWTGKEMEMEIEEHSSCRKHRIDRIRISTKARHDGGHDGFLMYRVSVAILISEFSG